MYACPGCTGQAKCFQSKVFKKRPPIQLLSSTRPIRSFVLGISPILSLLYECIHQLQANGSFLKLTVVGKHDVSIGLPGCKGSVPTRLPGGAGTLLHSGEGVWHEVVRLSRAAVQNNCASPSCTAQTDGLCLPLSVSAVMQIAVL